ncbi:MAG: tyrosine-protein phosphatase [Clostridia bacterium]|nr:tyrosine-protein phosphatase [Clostridia bacterium]
MKLKLPKSIAFYIFGAFVLAEAAIYIIFQIYDFAFGENLIFLKYAGILLCLAFAAAGIFFYKKDGVLVAVALVFTAISDLFILVLNTYYEVGISTFIVVQVIHFFRIYLISGKKPYISLAVRAGVVVVLLTVLGALGMLNSPVVVLSSIYFPQLLINAVDSAFLIKINKKYILLFVGLVLFTVCDICVGIDNTSTLGLNISADIQNFVHGTIWTVYLPAQVCIVLSERKTEYRPIFTKKEHAVNIQKLKLQKLNNTRDLGGFPVADGRSIKYGKLIRSGRLYKLPKLTLSHLENLGVTTVVDMRNERERLDYPDSKISGARQVNLPIELSGAEGITYTKSLAKVWREESKRIKSEFGTADAYMFDVYERLLFTEKSQSTLKEFFSLVTADENCFLWHCSAGKDRTGIAAMLLEAVLGVNEELIIEDYVISNKFQRNKHVLQKAGLFIVPAARDFKRILYALMIAKPEYIKHAIEKIKERYGSILEYCKQALELTDENIELLKNKYLE